MLAKLNLDQAGKYELAVAANKIGRMVVDYISGHAHFFNIGSEQGIAKWDDFIIEIGLDNYEHIQVKQQYHAFCKYPIIRGNQIKGDDKGKPMKLSPLDESMRSLGALFNNAGAIDKKINRTFILIVPNLVAGIKKDLTLYHLYKFLEQLTPSTTVPGIKALAAASSAHANIIEWLKRWCDFTDEGHIIHALRAFKIQQLGSDDDINDRTTECLSNCFSDTALVLEKIHSYIGPNTSYTSSISPRPLASALNSYLLPEKSQWTQFKNSAKGWEISGTHSGVINEIEYPSAVVPALWDKLGKGVMKYHSQQGTSCTLSRALIRLALHLRPAATAHISSIDNWRLSTRALIGNTLGLSDKDCDDLYAVDNNNLHNSSSTRTIKLASEHDDEANKLSKEMHNKTWQLVCEAMWEKFKLMPRTNLRDQIELRWDSWETLLANDSAKQQDLCKSMLHPKAEGDDIYAELRIGPKTVPLIVDGFYWLLVIAVCFNDAPNGWEIVGDQLTMNVKALCCWSGPAGQERSVRKLGDEGIDNLLGKESSKILLLSQVDSTLSELLGKSFIDDGSPEGSIASAHQPILIITNTYGFKKLLRKGDISEIRAFLKGEFDRGMAAKSL